jgi:hypothetical protein
MVIMCFVSERRTQLRMLELKSEGKGFFLLVEGSRIDMAGISTRFFSSLSIDCEQQYDSIRHRSLKRFAGRRASTNVV